MTADELKEIDELPSKYRPLGAWAYFGYSILFSIPLIGFICLIIFALDGNNINRRSYARSFFCVFILTMIIILIGVLTGVAGGGLAAILSNF